MNRSSSHGVGDWNYVIRIDQHADGKMADCDLIQLNNNLLGRYYEMHRLSLDAIGTTKEGWDKFSRADAAQNGDIPL